MATSRGEDGAPPEPPLFADAEEDTVRKPSGEIVDPADHSDPIDARTTERLDLTRLDTERHSTPSATSKIDTDREPLPSALMHEPASDELRRELSDGGFARVDTLPDGFAAILQRRALRPGDVVGNRYKLLEVLGGGAMGDVFVAENLAIGSRVAVKVLKPELLANPEFRQRFQFEAQAVGSIEHPNVARFFDLVVGDPTFLVVEYVRGETLATTLARETRMTVPRAVHLATRLAWGLDAAHTAGIIHRDLKPSNVILTADREQGEIPKLIDFGLAKIAAVAATEQITRTGQIIGTPAYMSPEQISGREVDARSDVYALACLLYEMIAGRPPFHGTDDVQTLYRQLHEPAEPLSLNAAGISSGLDKVVHRALAKVPAERYPSMQELARALNAAVEKRRGGTTGSTPALAGPPPRTLAVWVAATFVVGALAASGAWLWRLRHAGAAATGAAMLLVASSPPGARITVDGQKWAEPTPTAIRDVVAGAHVVRLSLAGHAPVEQHATVAAGGRALVEATLPPSSRALRIETVPAGALVYVDGVLQIGQTPAVVTVSDDDFHHLRIEKNGFELATRAIGPDDQAPLVTVDLVPEQQDRGTLMLDSDGVAEVWVDGEDSGFVSPTVFRLRAGVHAVQLRDGDEPRSAVVKVHIKRGEVTHLALKSTRE
jgi:serine/threonine-protein kinase